MMAARGEKPQVTEMPENGTATETEKIKYTGWKAMPYIVGNEIFEKLGALGTITNLVVYLTAVFHLRSITTATIVNVFNGTTNLAPVLGAFLADTYLGRYATLGLASVASQLGLLIIMLTAAVSQLHPPQCDPGRLCSGPTPGQQAFLVFGLAFLVIGAGGIRPCNLAFGADQFDPRTEDGRKGIDSFFNIYYFTFNIAMMISATLIIYVQSNVSWSVGLAIPAVLMFFSCAFFFLGSRTYVKVRPEGSPFSSIAQVLVAAFRKRRLKLPDDHPVESLLDPPHLSSLISKLSYTNQFRILDKAAIVTPEDEIKPDGFAANPWQLCTLQQVEQVKCIVRIIPVWSTGILYQLAATQQQTYVIFQALQSNRHLGRSNFQIPAASFVVFPMLGMSLWIPIYDRIVAPRLERITKKEGGLTLLQRMGIGLVLSVVVMATAGVIEERRRSHALRHHQTVSPFSSLWLIPPLIILGVSEAFNVISQVEFYYKQFPENMRSIAGSLLFCGFALGGYLSSLMVTVVHRSTGRGQSKNWLAEDLNKGKLDLFYFSIAVLGVLNFIYFAACAKWYRYKA
ncbi:protein NRT1/ PTR FAMILY 2.11-like [Musa acuminata AAA Group]|uniref:protein NRT1/ PTR FAMILY 2.11-like n=1 Tax=Musa acuminata AAA Group TaxID=214697 RepID=UPI0031E2C5AD